jgi:dTDP-4-amino-4,6-dideoxygalactose transaminase
MSSPHTSITPVQVPFFRPSLTQSETQEVLDTLRSGWLTTGDKVKRFETDFAAAVGSPNAVAVNSCTAALHLAVEALGLTAGQAFGWRPESLPVATAVWEQLISLPIFPGMRASEMQQVVDSVAEICKRYAL